MQSMNHFTVEFFEDEFMVIHYVGGENPEFIWSYHDNEEEAQLLADKLNNDGLQYTVSFDGVTTVYDENGERYSDNF